MAHRIGNILLALVCCGGCSAGSVRSATEPGVLPISGPGATATTRAQGPFLYVGGYLRLSEYAYGTSKPLRTIKPGSNAVALTLDSSGNLFAGDGNPSYGTIDVYEARNLKLLRRIYIDGPQAMAVDGLGYLYVANGGPDIEVYTPGGIKKVRTIKRRVTNAVALVFDHSGLLYVANAAGSVVVYGPTQTPGKMKFLRRITDGIKGPDALVFGPSRHLFVANWPSRGRASVSVYANRSSSPQWIVGGDIKAPRALAVDSVGRLFVACSPFGRIAGHNHGWVTVYAPGSTKPLRKITEGIDAPYALAIDPSNNIYVANGERRSVTVYSPGGAHLLRKITKGVDGPASLVFSSQ